MEGKNHLKRIISKITINNIYKRFLWSHKRPSFYCQEKKRIKKDNTYRHKGLGYTGEYSGAQGMNQDLVLCDSQHEQSGSIFGAQIQEQRGEASPTTTQKHTAI